MIEKEILVESIRTPRTREPGDIETLAKDIANRGLLHPVTIDRDGALILGTRRLLAAKLLDWPTIAAYEAQTLDEVLDQVVIDDDDALDPRRPLSLRETVELGRCLEKLYEPERRERQRAHNRRAGNIRQGKPFGEVPKRMAESMRPSQRIPRALGYANTSYQAMRHLVASLQHPTAEIRQRAEEQLALLEAGQTTLYNAYGRVRELTKDRRGLSRAPVTSPAITSPVAQRRALMAATTQLRGISNGLSRIEVIDAGITVDEANDFLSDLADARRETERIINKLRRHLTERNTTA